MKTYVVELEGTVEVDADDEFHAEDLALAVLHGSEDGASADIDFVITDVRELNGD